MPGPVHYRKILKALVTHPHVLSFICCKVGQIAIFILIAVNVSWTSVIVSHITCLFLGQG